MVLSLALPRSILLAENPTDSASETTRRYRVSVEPLLKKHCFQCHGDKDEVRGEVNFRVIETGPQIKAAFELWSNVLKLIETGSMPPETQPRLTPAEIAQFKAWYQQELVDTIAPLPDVLRPRRLSAHEYRQNTSVLFGFDPEVSDQVEAEQTVVEKSLVMKLPPVDPPGPSGFKNDTSVNPRLRMSGNSTYFA